MAPVPPPILLFIGLCFFLYTLFQFDNPRESLTNTAKMMRAARYYGKEDVRIEDTPRPQLSPGQILIKPSHVGICGTDLHEYIAGPTYVDIFLAHLFSVLYRSRCFQLRSTTDSESQFCTH